MFLGTAVPLLFCQEPGFEEEVNTWFASAPEASAYADIHSDIMLLLLDAGESGIPVRLLLAKVKEGAAKGVPSRRLFVALENERDRLRSAIDIIDSAGYPLLRRDTDLEQPVKMLGIILREGCSAAVLREILSGGFAEGRTLSEGTAACGAVFHVKKVADLSDQELVSLGIALYGSSLPPTGYDTVSSIFLKARVHRLSDKDTLDLVLGVLKSGGGLIQLERALDRRIQR